MKCIALNAPGSKSSGQQLPDAILAQYLLMSPSICPWGYSALNHSTHPYLTPPRDYILGASTAGCVVPWQLFNFPGVSRHLSQKLLPASQLPFCGAVLIQCAVEAAKPACAQSRYYFWFFSSLFVHLRWRTIAIQSDCLCMLKVWKNFFFSGKRNCTAWRYFFQQVNGQCVTTLALWCQHSREHWHLLTSWP